MERSLFRDFSRYASLNILGMISLSCYILADTFFISQRLGATGLAALNLSIPIYSVIHGVGLMIGIGGATRFSILQSQGLDKQADVVFSTALHSGVRSGLVFLIIGLLGGGYLAERLGADETTFVMTRTYLTTLLVFAPFFIANNVLLAFVRNDGSPKRAMIAMLTGSLSNIVLDWVFLYPLHMGMFGAVLATSLAPIISIGVLMPHLVKKMASRGALLLRERLSWRLLPDICSLGLSSMIVEVSSAVVMITFNLVILALEGNPGVAAYGIVANLGLVGVAVFTGLAQGIQPLISRFHGVQRHDLARRVGSYALAASLGMASVMYSWVFVQAYGIADVFNKGSVWGITDMAARGLRIYFFGYFFLGINVVATTYLSATEQTRGAFALSMARGLIIIVPLVIVLSKIWLMTGVWLAFVVTEFTVTALAFVAGHKRGSFGVLFHKVNR